MDIVFIVGSGRCGSTLVQEIVAKHKDVGFVSNIDDNVPWLNLKGRFNNAVYRTPLGRLTRKGTIRFAPSEAYRLIGRQVSPIYADSSRDLVSSDVTPWLKQRFRSFFEGRYVSQGKRLFLHKYTGWSRIDFFSEIFPEARFIHVLRDGRAVANSMLQMPWWDGYLGPQNWRWGELAEPYRTEWEESGRSYTVLAGIGWKILVESYERAAERLQAGRYLCIRYEDFLENPRQIMAEVVSFMELGWTQEFSKHLERRRIDVARRRAFEHDLSVTQLRQLNLSLSEKLASYGYIV